MNLTLYMIHKISHWVLVNLGLILVLAREFSFPRLRVDGRCNVDVKIFTQYVRMDGALNYYTDLHQMLKIVFRFKKTILLKAKVISSNHSFKLLIFVFV